MSKEISFSDFLKEGTLREEKHDSEVVSDLKPIHIEADVPANDRDSSKFWKELRHFFRTSERPGGVNGALVPALLAPILREGSYTNEYPVFVDEDGEKCRSISQLIGEAITETFEEKEARILRINLPRILREFNPKKGSEKLLDFEDAWKRAESSLKALDVHGDQKGKFYADIEKLKRALPESGSIIPFSAEAPILMLKMQLARKDKQRKRLLEKIIKHKAAIEELLNTEIKRKSTDSKDVQSESLDFASEMISMDKLKTLMPGQASEGLSKKQLDRLARIVDELDKGSHFLKANQASLIITEALFDEYDWKGILPDAQIIKASKNEGYKLTEKSFDDNIKEFTKLSAAIRIAELEIDDQYHEEVHSDFFDFFSRHHLSKEEMMHFPPILFVGETLGFLKNNLARFSALLSLNKSIRLLALEKRMINAPDPDINWEDASHSFRQELAAIAIAHRSTHTFQCSINYAEASYNGMLKSLDVDAPAFMHFLIPDKKEIKLTEVLKLASAVESRFFPAILYDLSDSDQWGSRFDISANPHPETNWPVYDLDYVDADGSEKKMPLSFTYADYKALTKEKIEELMLIPESIQNENLLPLQDYLEAKVEDLTGKVPYIYLVDESNCLKRAALPYMWIVSCMERRDNWNYIQELGGVNSFHVTEALKNEKSKWDASKAAEFKELETLHKKTLDNARSEASANAMERLTDVLMGLEHIPANAGPIVSNAKAKEAEEEIVEKGEPKKEEASVKEADNSDAESWVESFKCTTCNECTDKFPHIFAYNEDKQAYIKDDAKAKFSELVEAAEECPANCIHTGQPQDPKEKDLEALLVRAKAYI